MSTDIRRGTVRAVSPEMIWSFVRTDAGDVYVPAAITRELNLARGDKVEMEVIEAEKGLRARSVVRVEDGSPLAAQQEELE